MSTVSVEYTRKLARQCAKHSARFLDCPVAGSKAQVETSQLIILAGGDEEDVENARPLLLKMGKHVVYAGQAPNGTALKLCMNLIVAQMTTALAESAKLAQTLGIKPELIFSVIKESPALNCGYYRIKEKAFLNNDYSPAFSLKNVLKDVRFMNKEARERNLTLPVTRAVELLMEKSLIEGNGEEDLSVIIKSL